MVFKTPAHLSSALFKMPLFPLKPSSQRGLRQRWREVKSDALPGSTSERWWGTWKPGVLQSTASQRVQHSDWTIRMLCGNLWRLWLELRNLTEWQFRVPKVTDSHCDDAGLNLTSVPENEITAAFSGENLKVKLSCCCWRRALLPWDARDTEESRDSAESCKG